jgi:hypothetical protein
MFPHCNVHKYTWTSPDGKTHNQIDHLLVDRRRHSNVLDVRSLRAADFDSEQYSAEVSNRFAALEDLVAEVETNSAWGTIRENIKFSAKERHKPWFDGGCSKLLGQRKQTKLQWLHDPSKINGDNLNNVRREASEYFRNNKWKY